MQKLMFIGILLAFACNTFTQRSQDVLTISGRYGFPSSYENPGFNKATETGALINLTFALPTTGRTRWFNSWTYSPFNVSSDNDFGPGIMNPVKIHGFILQTGLVQKLGEDKALVLLMVPRFMTDFNEVNGKHWQAGAIGMFEKRFHDDLMLRFGFLYNTEKAGPLLTPLVYTDWHIGSKWSIIGMWPVFGKINYHVSDNFTTGIAHFGLVTSFQLGDPQYNGDYIERRSIDLSLFGRQRLAGNLHLEGRFGYAIGRAYEQYAEDQKLDFRLSIISFGPERTIKNQVFNPGPFVNLRLVYNMPL